MKKLAEPQPAHLLYGGFSFSYETLTPLLSYLPLTAGAESTTF